MSSFRDDINRLLAESGAPVTQPPDLEAMPITVHEEPLPDRRVICCNYIEGTGVATEGAKAYVDCAYLGGNLPDRVHLLARSRGGRWVEKWESMRRLGNFRFKTLPPEHPLYGDTRISIGYGDATDRSLERLLWAKERVGPPLVYAHDAHCNVIHVAGPEPCPPHCEHPEHVAAVGVPCPACGSAVTR